MTGLLPHSHGVVENFHYLPADQGNLRADKPHWAQRLADAGYVTGYFGKWHVERSNRLEGFGWQVNGGFESPLYQQHCRNTRSEKKGPPTVFRSYTLSTLAGYSKQHPMYQVVDQPPEERQVGLVVDMARRFLQTAVDRSQPWCCFVSTQEPHDPFTAGKETFDLYDVDSLPRPPNAHDELADRPGLYRKLARVWADMTDRQKREAAACYYASITEIDRLFGTLIGFVAQAGQLDDTLIVFTSDHGELLGAHGLYCKNVSAFEEIYNIPLIISGPSIAQGTVTDARVGLHDLCPTLLELVGAEPIDAPDSRSFASVLRNPPSAATHLTPGFAEYNGGRYQLTQRVVWEGDWKFVFNGFDFDELYNLKDDPYELKNLAHEPACQDTLRRISATMWQIIRRTGDQVLLNAQYQGLRAATFGPLIVQQ